VIRRDETVRQRIAFHAYRLMEWLGRVLPQHVGHRIYRLLGLAAHDLMPGVRRVVAMNQAQVLGRAPGDPLVRASTRDAFALYARYWFDTFHVPVVSDEWIMERFEPVDVHNLFDPLEAGTGVICALPHLGNWDAAGRWLVAEGQRLVSVAEQLEPERLFELFLEHRSSMGMDIYGLADPGLGRKLASAIADNRVIALVADRDLGGRGVEVTMFGRTRTLPAGPALLSITTGAPLIVCPVYQTPGGWRCVFGPPLTVELSGDRRKDVVAVTERMAEEFERAIAAAPSDWHMFQPGWPA
jgi:lauroyl/myristoyl acyltransferase